MHTKYAVSFTRHAEQDIEGIWSFIAEDNLDEATRFISKLEKQIGSLERFPERCPLVAENELMHTRYRHLVFGSYRTIFRISGKLVYVLRVIHSARLLETSALERVNVD